MNEIHEIGNSSKEAFWRWPWIVRKRPATLEEYEDIAWNARSGFWKGSEPSPLLDKRFTDDPSLYFRYELQPLSLMVPFGTIGLILLGGNFFLHPGIWMHGHDDYTGLLRMLMIFIGAFCIFMAWPRYRDIRTTPEEEQETEEIRERIRSRGHV